MMLEGQIRFRMQRKTHQDSLSVLIGEEGDLRILFRNPILDILKPLLQSFDPN